MKKCRCCRQFWPLECYEVCRPDGLRRGKCRACQRSECKRFRQRYYARHRAEAIERSRLWKAALRAEVMAMRAANA